MRTRQENERVNGDESESEVFPNGARSTGMQTSRLFPTLYRRV